MMNRIPLNLEDANNPYIIAFDPKPFVNGRGKKAQGSSSSVWHNPRLPHEWEVLREERQTYFEYDKIAREIFKDDFEEYMKAADDPPYMMQRIKEYQKDRQSALPVLDIFTFGDGNSVRELNDESFDSVPDDVHPLEEWTGGDIDVLEDIYDVIYQVLGGFEKGTAPRFKKESDLWQKAYLWASSTLGIMQNLYYDKNIKDKDIFRVNVNSYLVIVKIGIGLIHHEVWQGEMVHCKTHSPHSMRLFELARVYLLKCMESLELVRKKNLADSEVIQALSSLGQILLKELTKKINETSSK